MFVAGTSAFALGFGKVNVPGRATGLIQTSRSALLAGDHDPQDAFGQLRIQLVADMGVLRSTQHCAGERIAHDRVAARQRRERTDRMQRACQALQVQRVLFEPAPNRRAQSLLKHGRAMSLCRQALARMLALQALRAAPQLLQSQVQTAEQGAIQPCLQQRQAMLAALEPQLRTKRLQAQPGLVTALRQRCVLAAC